MDALFDHGNVITILLGIIALGFVVAWWMNRRVKYLALAGGVIVLIVLFWLLSRLVVTDQQQIRQSADAMAAAVIAQDADAFFKHVAKDFSFQEMNRKEAFDAVSRAIKLHKLETVYISDFRVEALSRAAGKARVSFRVRVDDDGGTVFFERCEADYVLEAGQWKLRTAQFFNPVADQDQPHRIPLH